ncbi:antirestriction protein ArdA [Brevibacillus brevis]|nr:antirestriction protein ArdA [Brevibacillus brevis]
MEVKLFVANLAKYNEGKLVGLVKPADESGRTDGKIATRFG